MVRLHADSEGYKDETMNCVSSVKPTVGAICISLLLHAEEEMKVTRSIGLCFILHTGRFIMFSLITNIYNKKTKGATLMEFFTATEKLRKFFFFIIIDVRYVHHG
jgi:hypothetical protein